MNYFLIAGEASGDMHAAALIGQLRVHDPSARFAGLGGDKMAEAGCRLYQDYRRMAFMGFAAVLTHLGQIRRNFQIARRALLDERPDVLVLIDYPSFNLRMAAFCRKHLPNTRICYYIPPKVWAWKRRRIHRIAQLCDDVLGIFPFEPDFYARYGYRCTYVGNPTAEQISNLKYPISNLQSPASLSGDGETIALLPGSRASEVTHCLPRMLEAARRFSGYRIVVTAAPGLDDAFYAPYLREGELLTRDTYGAVREARAAIVCSGTAALETALLRCPQVAVYHLALSWLLGILRPLQPMVFSIRYFTLVNIIPGRQVIRELVANEFRTGLIADELERLLHDDNYRAEMLRGYDEVRRLLGDSTAAETAAQIISCSDK